MGVRYSLLHTGSFQPFSATSPSPGPCRRSAQPETLNAGGCCATARECTIGRMLIPTNPHRKSNGLPRRGTFFRATAEAGQMGQNLERSGRNDSEALVCQKHSAPAFENTTHSRTGFFDLGKGSLSHEFHTLEERIQLFCCPLLPVVKTKT